MKTISSVFGGFAKFVVLIGGGAALLGIGLFFWSISETWDVRHTDSLLMWGGILSGALILMVIGAAIFMVFLRFVLAQQAQQADVELRRDAHEQPMPRYPQQQLMHPQGYPQLQGYPQQYAPQQLMQPQGAPYGYPQGNMYPQAPAPPPEGSFVRSNARYDLEIN